MLQIVLTDCTHFLLYVYLCKHVSKCVCICVICICLNVCVMCMYVCMPCIACLHVYMYVYVSLCACKCVHVCYVCLCVHLHECVYMCVYGCMYAKMLQLCPTFCDPTDCSPPGSSVYGILQARTLEWVAMPSCRGLSDSGIDPCLLHLLHRQMGSLPLVPTGKPVCMVYMCICMMCVCVCMLGKVGVGEEIRPSCRLFLNHDFPPVLTYPPLSTHLVENYC